MVVQKGMKDKEVERGEAATASLKRYSDGSFKMYLVR